MANEDGVHSNKLGQSSTGCMSALEGISLFQGLSYGRVRDANKDEPGRRFFHVSRKSVANSAGLVARAKNFPFQLISDVDDELVAATKRPFTHLSISRMTVATVNFAVEIAMILIISMCSQPSIKETTQYITSDLVRTGWHWLLQSKRCHEQYSAQIAVQSSQSKMWDSFHCSKKL